MTTIVVTRHPGVLRWLELTWYEVGQDAVVLAHVSEDDVRGQHVVGTLPCRLAALCASYAEIELPGLRPEQRGLELWPADMVAAGACLRRYRVEAL